MEKILTALLLVFCSYRCFGQVSAASANLDFATTSAMEGTFDVENAIEQRAVDNLNEILSHYGSAGIATAGIYLSKYKDRRSLTNVGLFSDSEEFYYQRIRNLVMNGINPMLLDVAIKLIKKPQGCLEWGPYLFRVTTNVENLCKEFELVVTNGKLSFKDVPFLVINTALRKYFDLSKFDGVNWRKAINDAITVAKNINIKKILSEFKNIGAAIATAGKNIGESNYAEISEIGKVFKTKPEEVFRLYYKYKDLYENIHHADNAKDILLAVIGTSAPKGIYKLFMFDDYSIEGFISDYLKNLSEQYYRQRWYIYSEDKGDEILCDYTPTPADGNDYNSSEWLEFQGKKDEMKHHYLTTAERNQLKQMAKNKCGWDEDRVAEYNKSHPNHHCEITYTLNHKDYTESYKHGFGGRHRKLHCFYSYSVVVEDKWNVEQDVYEEMYDSKTMDLDAFTQKMHGKLDYYNSTIETNETAGHSQYKLGKDDPAYYQEADAKQVKGASNVTFLANCHDGAKLAEGSFHWKENGNQGRDLDDKSKDFAIGNTIVYPNGNDGQQLADFLAQQEAKQKQLEAKLADIDKQLNDLIDQLKAAQLSGDYKKIAGIRAEQNRLRDVRDDYYSQLNDIKNEIRETQEAQQEYWQDQEDDDNTRYRILKNLKELGAAYQINWTLPGTWDDSDSKEYVYTVKGYCPSIKSEVTYTARLRVASPPKYLLKHFIKIRIHRAVLNVDYEITTHESSETVVDVMRLDKEEDAQSRADAVNKKVQQLMEDMPGCSIRTKYDYVSSNDSITDEDGIHLLWMSDRIDVAREVDAQLTLIYAQLVLIDKYLTQQESLEKYLKRTFLSMIDRRSRGFLANYAFSRWRKALMAADDMQGWSEQKRLEYYKNTENMYTGDPSEHQ